MEEGKSLIAQGNKIGKGLTRVWLPFYRFLTFSLADEGISTKRLIAISIEKGRVSIASGMRVLSKIMIKNAKRYSIEEDRYPNHNELVSFLKIFLNETGTRKADISLYIPKEWAVTRTVSLPSSVKENLTGVISYEMDRLTPFGSEDAFYDFRIISENTESVNILLNAVRSDVLVHYINAFKEAGFNLTSVAIDLSSIGTLLRYMGEDAGVSVIVKIDGNGYGCGTFIDGLMYEAYTGGDVQGESVGGLLSDVTSLINSARTGGLTPETVMLINGDERVRQQIESTTSIPVKIIDRTRFDYYGGDACTASGGVIESLWKDAKPLNLLKRGIIEIDKPSYVLTVVLLLALLISIGFYMITPLKVEEKRLQEINRQIAEKEEDVKKIEALKREIEAVNAEVSTINNFKGSRPLAIDVLKELTSILPKKAWLTGLSIRESTLEIDGYSTSATELLALLDASRLFSKVEFVSPTVRDAVMNSERFRIRMQIGEQTDEKK